MILIRDGTIVDGSGKPPFKADVLIKSDRISAIGQFPRMRADQTIDGVNAFITPGFIDVHSESDHYLTLFTNPRQDDLLLQGITTVLGGNCGASLAPLLYGSLKDMEMWADTDKINVSWHSVEEFLNILQQKKIGINFGTLIGHATMRHAIAGLGVHTLTERQTEVFLSEMKKSFEEGAFGFSFGLPVPPLTTTPYAELKRLAHRVLKMHGVLALRLRNEREGIEKSIKEAIRLAEETGVKMHVNHFLPHLGFENEFHRAMESIESIPNNIDFTFDAYPFDTSLTPIAMISQQSDRRENDIAIADTPGAPYLAHTTLKQFAENRGLSDKEAFTTLKELSKMRAVILYRNINADLAIQSLFHDRAFVTSNNAGFDEHVLGKMHSKKFEAFPRFLELSREVRRMPIEQAVRKITGAPAEKFGIQNRGVLTHGNYADVTILKHGKVTHTIVNGTLSVKDGALGSALSGKVLKRD